jgi:hypothetical protein
MTDTLKTFHLGDLLSLTTDKLLAPTQMQGLTDLIEHLIGRHVTNDVDLLLMSRDARAKLIAQHPWLSHVVMPDTNDLNELMTWFAHEIVSRGGAHQVIGIEIIEDDAIELLNAETEIDVEPTTETVTEQVAVSATIEDASDE